MGVPDNARRSGNTPRGGILCRQPLSCGGRRGRERARCCQCETMSLWDVRCKRKANMQFTGGSALLVPLNPDGTFEEHPDNNYLRFSGDGEQPSKCHQCVAVVNDCWIVDTGSACVRKMGLSGSPLKWSQKGVENVLQGHGPRQAVVSDNGKSLRVALVLAGYLSLQASTCTRYTREVVS